jgi:hypothetical protein
MTKSQERSPAVHNYNFWIMPFQFYRGLSQGRNCNRSVKTAPVAELLYAGDVLQHASPEFALVSRREQGLFGHLGL